MGFEYALVHLKYTIPPAIALTFIYRPFLNRIDVYKILFLISVAVVSTIPWDSYLIRRKIWTYPPRVVVGPLLFSIPLEEVFFFVIQTYNTSLIYLLMSKPVFNPSYLRPRKDHKSPIPYRVQRKLGAVVLVAAVMYGMILIWSGGEGTYLGLILAWAGPFALLLWSLSYQFLIGLPATSTIIPIALPTLYLWVVDTLALKRGTWTIESGTKLGLHLWEGLEIEEAIFFLATNTLIVFGLVAFDNALAVLTTFPNLFPKVPRLPSPILLIQALMTDTSMYDESRIVGLHDAVNRLQKKSRSFYLASSVFSGRLRTDLILLYSFCRVADDLVDNASTQDEARAWIARLTRYLDLVYASEEARIVSKHPDVHSYISGNFPETSQSALLQLPTHVLPYGPLYELLEGFKTDLEFHSDKSSTKLQVFPITSEYDLETYSARVAGTVAELCLELVFHHGPCTATTNQRDHLVRSGAHMGIALQYVNIARDITRDAAIGRVYLPTSWLKVEGMTPEDILDKPDGPETKNLRGKLLDKAFEKPNQHLHSFHMM
ncbi:terpanoid synthase [Hyphodiscus hymeniophilus]|uniref:Bifunctional lycopene cyclase/phytoene synthase n=1 Tax=Hyphodiscus hymeniophilus TaxID=353542 RepID=A0A9P7AY19_9HELO|nr:terpanoid synthase [Hyphodiscus hymeniophilus]